MPLPFNDAPLSYIKYGVNVGINTWSHKICPTIRSLIQLDLICLVLPRSEILNSLGFEGL